MTTSLNTTTNRLMALGMDPALANEFGASFGFNSFVVQFLDSSGTYVIKNAAGTAMWTFDNSGNLTLGAGGNSLTLSTAGSYLAVTASNALTAAGSAITDALQLVSLINNVTTVTSSTGVKLAAYAVGTQMIVRNGGASNLLVYPPNSSGTINGGTAGAAITLATSGKHIGVFSLVATNTWIASDSASAS